ncbi:hypothetical protein B0H16DRAFT_1803414 [Mycena metata]|uniref:Uncharacterized protein n=1 Tax=Mycena metata TaxID=1033252 RepID=A0AAD7P0W6_9AGAR|nr:hypothetical protein B0H16DRAFT_1803414 [Mycena metata]
MDLRRFEEVRGRLGRISPPTKQLRLANGEITRSLAHWEGEVEVEGVKAWGAFEVFDSRGSWDFLFSKPIQAALGVIHDVKGDIITLKAGGRKATISNQNAGIGRTRTHAVESTARPAASTGAKSSAIPPARRVPKFFNPESAHRHHSNEVSGTHSSASTGGKKTRKEKRKSKTRRTSTGAQSEKTPGKNPTSNLRRR